MAISSQARPAQPAVALPGAEGIALGLPGALRLLLLPIPGLGLQPVAKRLGAHQAGPVVFLRFSCFCSSFFSGVNVRCWSKRAYPRKLVLGFS